MHENEWEVLVPEVDKCILGQTSVHVQNRTAVSASHVAALCFQGFTLAWKSVKGTAPSSHLVYVLGFWQDNGLSDLKELCFMAFMLFWI